MRISRRGIMAGGAAVVAAAVPVSRALAAGRPPIVNSIALEKGRVWIAALIEGKGPHFFLIDTGSALSFITDDFAKSIGLEKTKGQPRYGIGGGVSDYGWYIAKEVRLASGTRFADMVFAGARSIDGEGVGGFGSGMFTSYDSDFDFVKGEWRVYPDGRGDFAGLKKLPSHFTKERIAPRIEIDVSIDGFATELVLDTGASMDALLSGRAAARSGLWDDSKPYAPTQAKGFGREGIPSRYVRGTTLSVGEFTFERPLVMVNAPGTVSRQNGLLGLGVLQRLNLTTQASSGTVWAARNGVTKGWNSYPLSGLWLDQRKDGGATIADVGTGSPAAAAGLKKGDVVTGAFPELLRAIAGGPGKQVTLTVASGGGAPRAVQYTLAPWL
ncbi:aspartyl protease family protein [Sphingomonas hengshuiensis]|uniref:PDZ domain-containing protein n=1 Tax=Sphingomonas hengshuiensis TaxID=1609977 RepID=A0A7U4LEY6_9SPHN|nr:aspartyl protease family protein [Sphingomonas hengshuiensis]AJP71564.1 hypothetical protein TS85_06875 [Sphingomonas hengshuiensis]